MGEGLALTALVAVGLRLRPSLSASTRVLVWWSTLVVVLLGSGLEWPGWGSGVVEYAPAMALPAHSQQVVSTLLPTATTILIAVWLVVVMIRVVVLSAGVLALRRWRTRCRPLDRTALPHLPAWSQVRAAGRQADVMVSPDVRSPCVLGLCTPIIALPPAAMTLSARALDAILVHEYAHVQRRDDVTQFLQHLTVALCALHPAVWWIDRQLTVEREAACDDWVVTLATPTRAYAACLRALAAGERIDTALMPVRMTGRHSQLASRVRRLVDTRRARRLSTSWPSRVTAPAAVMAAMCLVASAVGPGPAPVALPMPVDVAAVQGLRRMATPTISAEVARPGPEDARRRPRSASVGLPDRAALSVVPPPPQSQPIAPAPPRVAAVPSAPSASSLPASVQVADIADFPPALSSTSSDVAETADNAGSLGTPFRHAGLALADAGVVVGEGVTRGGRATGGFLTRLGKRVARTF